MGFIGNPQWKFGHGKIIDHFFWDFQPRVITLDYRYIKWERITLVGATPLKKYEFVSWDDGIPNIWKVMKFHGSKPPSSTEKMLSFFRWDEKISNIWGIFRVSTGTHLNPMIQTVIDKP